MQGVQRASPKREENLKGEIVGDEVMRIILLKVLQIGKACICRASEQDFGVWLFLDKGFEE